MPKSMEEKVFRYVKDGRLKRLRSFLKKHKLGNEDVNQFIDSKKRTPFHIACMLGEDAIARVLLRHGASLEAKDEDLNTPLHLALKYALQTLEKSIYSDLISPLIRVGIDVIDVANRNGETPRTMIKEFKEQVKKKAEDRKIYEEEEWRRREEKRRRREETREWNAKLFYEVGCDDVSTHHDAFTDDDENTDDRQESYDDWAERMLQERRQKHFILNAEKQKEYRKHRNEQKDREARDRTRILEEEHQAYIRDISLKRTQAKKACLKSDYELCCSNVFDKTLESKLCFHDIPWPCEGSSEEMVKLLSTFVDGEDRRKYLKEQQIRWHPDKFLQKCGDRLEETDRDRVMEYVKQLSQGINALIEDV